MQNVLPITLTTLSKAEPPLVTASKLKAFMSRYAVSTKELARWLGMSHTYVYTLLSQEGALQCRPGNADKLAVVMANPSHLLEQWEVIDVCPSSITFLLNRMSELNLTLVQALRRLPPETEVRWVAVLAKADPLPPHLDDWLPWADALWLPQNKLSALWVEAVKQWLTQGRPASAKFTQCLQALEASAVRLA